jgi:L-lysine exporter family protein LysE/ArgO
MNAYTTGLAMGSSLLVAIGAQNAFVLRQGLRREHVFLVVLACVCFDCLLIAAGVGGMGAMVTAQPRLATWFAVGGAVFLVAYGLFALRRAASQECLSMADRGAPISSAVALIQCAAFTFLNPHVYLDTVVLLGSIGGQQPTGERLHFFLGAITASTSWFFLLGYGAGFLAPVFARPLAWRLLDAIIGLTMFVLAWTLLSPLLATHGASIVQLVQ